MLDLLTSGLVISCDSRIKLNLHASGGGDSLTVICAAADWSWGEEESAPPPAWGQVKATRDKCRPIAHNRPTKPI